MIEQKRLENLNIEKGHDVKVSRGYSAFVKAMRWLLPVIALILGGIVIAWPKMEDKLLIVPKEDLVQQSNNKIGENELLTPHFETVDSNGHPVHVNATRALHNQENPNLVRLENPNADLQMKNGAQMKIKALNGTYEQETEKLFLQDNVTIKHESGYELKAQELRVDMKTREAFSDKNIEIDGPAATINAIGLEGNVDKGVLIFKGPATLILKPTKTPEKTEGKSNDT